jgi:hypothetical protein
MELGIYTHYKGGRYEVIGLATESDTEAEVVVYKSVETGRLFTRNKSVFLESVKFEGKQVPRFILTTH